MIRPTLFVGLGTTGTNILKSLRRLLFEEYGHAGLPIFRYIAIETHTDEKGEDPDLRLTSQLQDYERIMVVNATIGSTVPIHHKLTPSHPRYNQHLADWLDPELLKVETRSFQDGAKNIRMAGRLCLWENWLQMQQKVTNARDAIIAQSTTDKTADMLTGHYESKGLPIPAGRLIDNSAVNVYIVGSLCGGSCSGMLIDVAYFFRSMFASQEDSRIYGVFTMYDRDQATAKALDRTVRSANCYGSLLELNYYNHTDTTYNIVFPTGHAIEKMRRKPFDYATFVSRSSRTSNIKHVLSSGGFDEDGLNLMVALNLFAETAGDTDGEKALIRTDWESYEGVGGLKPVSKGEIPVMVRDIASFGLTAVWYPKYRIASAAACLVSQDLCKTWLDKHVPQSTTLTEAANEWRAILTTNMDVLTSPEGQQPLRSQIASELNRLTSNEQLQKAVGAFSTVGTFQQKFNQGGQYVELIKVQVPYCEEAFRSAIEAALNNQLAAIDFEGTRGLADVRALFEALDREVEKTIQTLPDRLPTLDLRFDWTPIQQSEGNLWTKLIGLHAQAVEESKETLIQEYHQMILGGRDSAYQKMRNFHLRAILQKLRAELGFGVQPMTSNGPNSPRTIKQRLDQIESNLSTCDRTFQSSYEAAISTRNSASVKIVTDNPKNEIEIDAGALRTKISDMNTFTVLLGQETMSAFLAKGAEPITIQMTETYRRLALEQIPVKDVVTKAIEILQEGGEENEIMSMASRSNPYQSFNQNYDGFTLGTPPKMICGYGSTDGALEILQNSLGSKEQFFPRLGHSSVDHLLFFYEEEAGFALDDLEAHATLEEHFLNKPGVYGHLTHQDPDCIDLGLHQKSEKLNRWCRVLARLVPEIRKHINNKAFAGLFRLDYGRYVFEYHIDGLLQTLGLYEDPDGIKRLSHMKNASAYKAFVTSVQSKFAQIGRQNIAEKIINPLLREVKDLDMRQRLGDFYNQFLDEVYPNGGFAERSAADVEAEWDSHFFGSDESANEGWGQHSETRGADADDYDRDVSEEEVHKGATFTDADSENGKHEQNP